MKTGDFYQTITDNIIDLIAAGTKPWVNPVLSAPLTRPLRHNSSAYQGINVVILWVSAMTHGFASNHWFTFKPALDLGAAVRKGERGTHIYFAKQVESDTTDPETGDVATTTFSVGRCYTVFNASQIDNLPSTLR